jgi:hypothetical protein
MRTALNGTATFFSPMPRNPQDGAGCLLAAHAQFIGGNEPRHDRIDHNGFVVREELPAPGPRGTDDAASKGSQASAPEIVLPTARAVPFGRTVPAVEANTWR